MFSLVVLNGSSPGTTLRLDPEGAAVTIGRLSSRELQLDDHRASRLHSRVWHHEDHWHIEDCGSLNGTFVNSEKIDQVVLQPGDLIRIAERLILFVKDSDEAGDTAKPGVSKSTTLLERLPTGDARGTLLEKNLGESVSRVVRDSAVLCRLANQLHERTDTKSLLRVAVEALVDGIGADLVSIWLIGTDGRLRCAARSAAADDPDASSKTLARLAVERNRAFLIEHDEAGSEETMGDNGPTVGRALGVPIPGATSCRGAIECRRRVNHEPFSLSDLDFTIVVSHQAALALENLEYRERLELANLELRRRLDRQSRLVGSSRAMQDVLDQIARVGPTSSTVLILGESGAGKELVAQAIHELSPHNAGPYVAVNCAAFGESLLESELFGHEQGAFTGADRQRIGQFERAHRGTIFLDEIGEMSPACQAKVLRVLEGHPFQRVGGEEPIHVDVRLIAATHRDLQELIRQGRFREDLFYRLRVIDLHIPPLRLRGDDVLELASRFLQEFRHQTGRGPVRLSQEAVRVLREYAWPGNVRELKNAIERAVVLGQTDEIEPADLGLPIAANNQGQNPQLVSLKEAQRRHIEFVLRQVDGNKTQACTILGIGRGTLYKKLEETDEDE
ncbi:MAG: sigma 54-interacting transcriptional regulator [Pirellulales bacterium]|nr:sigma 54-interacting transcriptional regulator [Pirellulales bacterium]